MVWNSENSFLREGEEGLNLFAKTIFFWWGAGVVGVGGGNQTETRIMIYNSCGQIKSPRKCKC